VGEREQKRDEEKVLISADQLVRTKSNSAECRGWMKKAVRRANQNNNKKGPEQVRSHEGSKHSNMRLDSKIRYLHYLTFHSSSL
jgi:hypothetical protein